jgi:hypothetical protein
MSVNLDRWMLAGAALCLLTAAGCQPPKTPAGQLRISTEPAGAAVTLDGAVQDPSPVTVSNVPPGEHLIEVSKAGYEDMRRTVSLTPDQRLALDLQLDQTRGLVLVTSEPTGAEVSVNDAVRGNTPLLITDLPLGQYRLKLATDGYMPKTVDLSIKDRVPLKVEVPLTSDSASLILDSEPAGATVAVNGVPSGTTPCTVDRIPAGDCKLEVTLEGYAPYVSDLKLAVGQQQKITIPLAPLPPELTIVSLPEKARVYVDNQYRGETPLTLKDLPPGECRVRAELPGYEPVARTVTLNAAEKRTEEFRLEGDFGTLEISTEPPGVTVVVDGKARGVTEPKAENDVTTSRPLTIGELGVGSHTVRFTRKGFVSKEVKVDLKKDATASLQQRLERDFKPNYQVITLKGKERGYLMKIDTTGSIQLEVRPGVFRTIPASEIRSHGPIEGE